MPFLTFILDKLVVRKYMTKLSNIWTVFLYRNEICFTSSPQVRMLSNKGKFHDARSEHSHQVFFLYVGTLDPKGDVMVRTLKLRADLDTREVCIHQFVWNSSLSHHMKFGDEQELIVII